MINFSQLLAERSDAIVERWIAAVRQDRRIESTNDLPYVAVRDHIPHILKAMVSVLSETQPSDIQLITQASFEHGVLRAGQGFNAAEIAQEYRLLRQEVFSAIESELLGDSAQEVVRVFRSINAVIDTAIAQCFQTYVDERLRELEQLQQQLTLTQQELTRLLRVNQDNLSHLAHELKTPLNSIIGYSELFLRQQQRYPGMKDTLPSLENIERVLRNGRQLLRLINDTLELAKCDSGNMRLHLSEVEVQPLINQVLEVLQPLIAERGLQLTVNCDRAPQKVVTDALRLQQILMNLLSNAVRYTEVGSVQIQCEVLHQQWAIAVSDTGVGIPLEDQAQIFDPFVRVASGDRCHLPDSTGLGLAIVARLVKLLQGQVELVSQVGVGSTFTVTLPLKIQTPETTLFAMIEPPIPGKQELKSS